MTPRLPDPPGAPAALDSAHLERLSRLLLERVGLQIRSDGWGSLRLAVAARLGSRPTREEIDAWLHALERDEAELRRLLPLVTVGKTCFFRDERQFAALAELLPGLLLQARAERRRLSIWSAGCATGEEVHSLAMAALEAGADPAELEILGTDVNPAAVAFASGGRYPEQRLEGLSATRQLRFFTQADGVAVVQPRLREAIAGFRVHNLAEETYPLPAARLWDVIFCRNVLIYFNLQTTVRTLERFERALRPGGHLFLGYSESLFRIYDGFELVERAGSFFYRRPLAPRRPAPPPPPLAPIPERRPAPPPASPPPQQAQPSLQEIAALITAGRFHDARVALEERLRTAPEDVGARLTLGNLLALLRLPDEARACYEKAVELEPLRAEGHLLFGLHLLAEGDAAHAAAEISRALFLEPDLGLGHYFLGRCRERLGDLDGARRAYRNALGAFRGAQAPRRFLGFYPDLPADDGPFASAAESALRAL